MIRVGVHGAGGRMGRHVLDAVIADPACCVAAAVDRPGHPGAGQVLVPESPGQPEVVLTDELAPALATCDVVIDFSLPEPALAMLDLTSAHKVATVVATTGFDEPAKRRIARAAEQIGVVFAPNYSIGIAVLTDLVRAAAQALPGYDVEVLELHHTAKVDAPSGTALRLAEEAADARGQKLADVAVYHREGRTGPREVGTIGMQTLRAGSSPGEHTIFLAGPGERLELTHRAQSREGFATGSVRAARWLVGRAPGLYDLRDVLRGDVLRGHR